MTGMLASLRCVGEIQLVIGCSGVAYARIKNIVAAGAHPILLTECLREGLPQFILSYLEEGKASYIQGTYDFKYLTTLGRKEVDGVVDKVYVVLPIAQEDLKQSIFKACTRNRIPINTADSPNLCTFTLLSSYSSGDFQLGVSTLGKGCKLANRIKRDIISILPSNIGEICDKVGELRKRIYEEDELELLKQQGIMEEIGEHDEDAVNSVEFNSLVKEFNMTKEEKKLRRARWLSQVVEYYPLRKLADISIDDLTCVYKEDRLKIGHTETSDTENKIEIDKKGTISLVGSGPGSVSLLTLGALHEIYSADLILADKLVPEQVLKLIPRRTKVFIARKFPGNAEKAQQELLEMGLQGVQRGEKVVRLKQGDPYIFGRGGEEFNFFAERGFIPLILPGITSSLAAPVLTNITPTQREVADQVLICTGTGRRGTLPQLPSYVKTRTTVFLMALHRISDLIPKLIEEKNWDPNLPAAIIERASCPDQRVIRARLKDVVAAVEACGSRPPGLLVTGFGCDVIEKTPESGWTVEEGCTIDSSLSLGGILQKIT